MNWRILGKSLDPITGRTERWNYSLDALAIGSTHREKGYRGRPLLVTRIRRAFQSLFANTTRSTAVRARAALSHFWRFLDYQEQLSRVLGKVKILQIDDLEWIELEALWRHFIDWLRSQSPSSMSPRTRYYANYMAYSVFTRAFDLEIGHQEKSKPALNIYVYFSGKASESYNDDHIEFDDVKIAFRHLAESWRDIQKRLEKGREKANSSTGYTSGSGGANRWNGGSWPRIENRLAYILREIPFMGTGAPSKRELKKRGDRLRFQLPSDLCWEEGDYATSGVDAHVACVFLRAPEIAVSLAMVTMKTGLNLDAVTRMTVDDWFRLDPLLPEKRVIVYGPKRVSGKRVRAYSSIRKMTDPYRIISKVIEIQAPLRQRMLELAAATGDQKLARRAKLIWIFPNGRGISDLLPGRTKEELHKWLDKFFASRMPNKTTKPFRYRFSDGRDIWGLFVYHRSGFNHILTMQALGHSTITSLLHYLEKRVVVIEERKRLVDLQDRVLVDLKGGKYSPAAHRIARAQRTASGLHCTDAQNPDHNADPGNPGGRNCVAQRCFVCTKWYATRESLVLLSRIVLDLEELRECLALAVWETSDFPVMVAVYSHIRGKFHRSLVEAAIEEARHLPRVVPTSMFVGDIREARS